MKLSVFDLDHTLLPIDTGDRWSRWLVRHAGLDRVALEEKISAFARAYHEGNFDPVAFVEFQFSLLQGQKLEDLIAWRDSFIKEVVQPAVRPEAIALVESRRNAGFEVLLASGTHRFVTEAVAPLFHMDAVVGATPEMNATGDGFTGRLVGSHSYGVGKLKLVQAYIEQKGQPLEALEAWSDSINDLPLLSYAAQVENGRAVAVNPDDKLLAAALREGWEVIELFRKERADV